MPIEGSYRIPPVKFEGSLEYGALEEYMDEAEVSQTYDIEYMNTLIDLIIFQTELEAQLGTVVFKLYMDPDDGEQSPELAVEYSDGSWEWLETIMDAGDSKRLFLPAKQ